MRNNSKLTQARDTIQDLQNFLDDVGLVLSLIIKAEHKHTAQAIASVMQIAVESYSDCAKSEVKLINDVLNAKNGGAL